MYIPNCRVHMVAYVGWELKMMVSEDDHRDFPMWCDIPKFDSIKEIGDDLYPDVTI